MKMTTCVMVAAFAAAMGTGCAGSKQCRVPSAQDFASRHGVTTETVITSVPGRPDRIYRRETTTYQGPATPAAVPVQGTPLQYPPPTPATEKPQYLPPPQPMPATDKTVVPPARQDTGKELPKSGRPAMLGEPILGAPVAVPTPAKPIPLSKDDEDDDVIPEGRIEGVYGVGPNGERIPAKRYDADGKPLDEPKQLDGPVLPLPPGIPQLPPALPKLPQSLPPLPQGPTLPPVITNPARTASRTK